MRPPSRNLRDEGHLLGLGDLTVVERRAVENDNAVIHFYKSMIDVCERIGKSWTLEARGSSWLWEMDFIRAFEGRGGVQRAEFQSCAFGGPTPTRLGIIGRVEGLMNNLTRFCVPGHRHHKVEPEVELQYPVEFAQTLAWLIHRQVTTYSGREEARLPPGVTGPPSETAGPLLPPPPPRPLTEEELQADLFGPEDMTVPGGTDYMERFPVPGSTSTPSCEDRKAQVWDQRYPCAPGHLP